MRGDSTLLLAPTGSGKTLAAFLAAIDRLMWQPQAERRCRVLYVSPLKALAVDVERNLRVPIEGIAREAHAAAEPVVIPRLEVRTGDTPASQRARMRKHAPDILITTPESLYLLLASQARQHLASVETVIVDEIHALAPSKRGTHLFLSLERLEALRQSPVPLQRIGLSATQRPLDEIATLLGGYDPTGARRPVRIVDASAPKRMVLSVEVPDVDMAAMGDTLPTGADEQSRSASRSSIWPHIHARVAELIRQHRTTLVFVNSRRVAERLAAAVNLVAGEPIAMAHHGSIAREKRQAIESRLKDGALPAIVATSSLELGIDMGSVDLVIQIEAPLSVASGLQRIGRACHGVSGTPRGVIVATHRGDLVACAAAAKAIREGAIEPTFYPRNALDVLAQQIVAISADGPLPVQQLFELVRRAAPYSELPRQAFDDVLDMLSGIYPSEQFAELKPRITWDRTAGTVRAREGARRLAIVSGGTIPDRGLYGVFLAGEGGATTGGMRVGELDEEMVFELRVGEVFLLGASSWRAEAITHDRVVVSPAPGRPGKMPFWHGDRPGRSPDFGQRIGALARTAAESGGAAVELEQQYRLGAYAVRNLTSYLREQLESTGEMPSDQTIVVERYIDDTGDWRVCVLSPFGTSVHAPWSMAVRARLEAIHASADVTCTDDGMVFRVPGTDTPPATELFFPASATVEREVTEALGGSSLFAARFRECAARALLLPRRSPTRRTPLWAQRRRAGDLLAVASRFPSFPIVLEAYRECLRDVFDLPALQRLLAQIESRTLRVVTVDSTSPSPFAAQVLFSFVGNFMYLLDAPLAERRAQALSIDHRRLRELLGEAELRKLLDPAAIDQLEDQLQGVSHPARSADGLHDLLLRVGELSDSEIAARTEGPPEAWIAELLGERRIAAVRVGRERRYIAAEDAGRYHEALGVEVPAGLPEVFMRAGDAPLESLVARSAHVRGPFGAEQMAARFGLARAQVEQALDSLVRQGRLAQGQFLPQGRGAEYCDVSVLRTLRERSLARLRRQVQPVPFEVQARFLAHWHGLERKRKGPGALLEVVRLLQGCPLAASALESDILPARLADYRPWELDALCASGRVRWVGLGPLGTSDASIALYLAEDEPLLAPAAQQAEGELAGRIRAVLQGRGAVFLQDLVAQVGGFPAAVLDALWSMVWAGEVTNDTFEPLRGRLRSASLSRHRSERARPDSGAQGRWSLRASGPAADPTSRAVTLARSLLDRYGVVVREVAQAESIAGGFSAIYPVLRALEESGQVRRGYFVEGRGGTQFAVPGAEEQLRSMRDNAGSDQPLVLSAIDPANPWGALAPWPERKESSVRAQRIAGAHVMMWNGRLLGWLGRGGLVTFVPEQEPPRKQAIRRLARALRMLLESSGRRALLVPEIDGSAAAESPLAAALVEEGFVSGSRGLLLRKAARSL